MTEKENQLKGLQKAFEKYIITIFCVTLVRFSTSLLFWMVCWCVTAVCVFKVKKHAIFSYLIRWGKIVNWCRPNGSNSNARHLNCSRWSESIYYLYWIILVQCKYLFVTIFKRFLNAEMSAITAMPPRIRIFHVHFWLEVPIRNIS